MIVVPILQVIPARLQKAWAADGEMRSPVRRHTTTTTPTYPMTHSPIDPRFAVNGMTLLNMLNFLPYDVDELHELLALFRVFPGDARAGAAAHLGRSGKNRQQAAAGGLGTWQPVPGRTDETSPAYDRSANLKLIKDRSPCRHLGNL